MRRTRRILLLLLLPVVGFPALVAVPISERWIAFRALEQAVPGFAEQDTLSRVQHALQRERLAALMALSGQSPLRQASFAGRRQETDAAIADWHSLPVHADTTSDVSTYGVRLIRRLAALQGLRTQVAQSRIDPATALADYSALIEDILVHLERAAMHASHPVVARARSSHAAFLALKESHARVGAHLLLRQAQRDPDGSGPGAPESEPFVALATELEFNEQRFTLLASGASLTIHGALVAEPAVRALRDVLTRLVEAPTTTRLPEIDPESVLERFRVAEALRTDQRAGLVDRLLDDTWWDAAWFTAWAGVLGLANLLCLILGFRMMERWARKLAIERDEAERLGWIAQHTQKMAIIANMDGRIDWVNDGFVRMTGYDLADVHGRDPGELLTASSQDQVTVRQVTDAIARHTDVEVELQMQNRDGRPFWVRLEIRVLHGVDQQVRGFIALGTDITWQKDYEAALHHVEQQLRASESRLKRAMSGSSDGYWDLDLARNELYVSPRFAELLGHDPRAVTGTLRPDDDFMRTMVHPDDLGAMQAAHAAHLAYATPYDVTARLKRRDGSYRWFRIRAATEYAPDARPLRLSGVVTDVNELKEIQGELEWRALHDPLTGLANRQNFLARLQAHPGGERRGDASLRAILSMDFDRFKLINDVHGHQVGDELLCAIGKRLRTMVREQDLIARFGGDEFIILLVDAGSAEAVRQVTARISGALAQPHVLTNGTELTCTASIGVIVLEPSDDRPADLILRDADAAMYQAKNEAKGSYRFFDRELRSQMNRKARLEADLRRAEPERDFRLLYQPIIDLRTGRVAGFEALLRWQREGREPIEPAVFIPMAEDTGLIVGIGAWVFERACRDLARWRTADPAASELTLSINVSRRELIEPDFAARLTDTVRRAGLESRDVTLELTETALVDERFDLRPLARELRDRGFRLAMDDFGTGQSSLNSLVDLPIHTLKIDKRFVRNMGSGQTSIAVVHAVVTLAAHLGLDVVAEGIESAVEVGTLQSMNCHYGQGYHFAKPVPANEALAMVLADRTADAGAAETGTASAFGSRPIAGSDAA